MKISKLKINSRNINEQLEFYNIHLGFKLIERSDDYFSVQIGSTILTFIQSDSEIPPFYHFAINIPENKINEALCWLEKKVEILEDEQHKIIHFQSWNAHSIYFNDPSGNIVEVIARHSLNNASNNDEFSVNDFLRIDEIGLPVSDVLSCNEKIKNELNILNWREPHPRFTTTGDEEGLFILVQEGRVWYMSDKPATVFPIEVTLFGAEDKELKIGKYVIKLIKQLNEQKYESTQMEKEL